ncbi:MAG TPA: IS630 family transposase, partial [Dermatophilaceae bacterium]
PLLPGAPARAAHDHKRHGAGSLFAALDAASGKLLGSRHARPRALEFKRFLATLEREVPAELEVHLILDNYATHKTPALRRWLRAHPRFVLHFTPSGASWPNLVERWFAELTARRPRRGVQRSARELGADIRDWLAHWNEDPRPFIWTKTSDQILETIAGSSNRITDSEHY